MLLLLVACQPQGKLQSQLEPTAGQEAIDPVSLADSLLPRELYTDYASPYGCHWTSDSPQLAEQNIYEPHTVWERINRGMVLEIPTNQRRFDAEFNWYHRHPEYMKRVTHRSRRYIHYVTEQLEEQQLPLELALLPIVESAYDPFAYSHGRASGMWQFIPGTGRMYNLDQTWWFDGRRDVVDSTQAAINYLKRLNKIYDGDWLLALAAYNSGQGTVSRAIRKNRAAGKPTDFWSLQLPRETRSYVPKLLALAKIVDNPGNYDIELEAIPNQAYFAIVDTQSQIDLAEAAAMADVDIEEIYRLNPGFNRWATAPKGPHRLLVPVSQHSIFIESLAARPATERLHWERYTVKTGDSLLLLAKRYNTGVDTIKQVNNIRGNMIRAGQSLMIPVASMGNQHYSLSADQRLASIQKNRKGKSGSKQFYHTVQSGESFWTISRKYQVSVANLARWNGIAPKDVLRPGQKLSVWASADKVVAAPTGQRQAMVRKVGYKVRNGDSLARIAGRFNVRVQDIVRWNSVNPERYLQPGQHLTLYVDVTNAYN